MTLLEFVRLSRHNLWLILAAIALGLGAGAAYSMTQPVLYASTSTGLVIAGTSTSVGEATAAQTLAMSRANSYTVLVSTRDVVDTVREQLAAKYGHPVGFSLSASVAPETALFRVTAVCSGAAEAKDAADFGVKATSEAVTKLESLNGASETQPVIRLQTWEAAAEPASPVSPNWRNNLLFGAAGGLILGYLLAFARRGLDSRIRQQDDLEAVTGAGVLGVIPKVTALSMQRKVEGEDSLGASSEAFRQLRTNLRYVNVDSPPRSIVITSGNPAEGKSTVAANLGRVLAESGTATVLVDADLRRPSQHVTFDRDGAVGLTQVLAGEVKLADALVPTDQESLWLLPAGRIPPNPSELVGSQRMHALIAELATRHTVLIDAPPLLPVTDAGLLAAASDGTILVVATGRATKEELKVCVRLLSQVKGRLLGSVMNLASPRKMGSVIYGYGYGRYTSDRYYAATKGTKGKTKSPKPSKAKPTRVSEPVS